MINVYICHPYASDPEANVKKVKKLVESLASTAIAHMKAASFWDKVYVPISPMLAFPDFMSEAAGVKRKYAMAFCISLLSSCSEIWVCSRDISDGMAEEISYASEHGIKVVWKV